MQGDEESVVFLVGKVTKGGRIFKDPNLKAFMTTLSQDLSSLYSSLFLWNLLKVLHPTPSQVVVNIIFKQ